MAKKYRTGIVLSGGGAHGIAHAGVLKALNESGIYPEMIVGVSAGAMVGVLYADNIPPDEIFNIFKKEKVFSYPGLKMKNRGLLNSKKVIDRLIGKRRIEKFSDLELSLAITTSNFNSGKQTIFTSGNIYGPLCATISVPLLFSGIEIEGDLHYDGGLIDNLPVELAIQQCDKVIGVNVNPINRIEKFNNFQEMIIRTAHIGITARLEGKAKLCDLFLEPEGIMNMPILNDSKLDETFRAGYDFTRKKLNSEILNKLSNS